MKKIIIPILIFIFAFSLLAQDSELPQVSLTPDNPFYFLKIWKERIQTFFTFGNENKAKQYLHLAEVRLAEYLKMVEKGKNEIAQRTLDKYENQLGRALSKLNQVKEKGRNVEGLLEKVSQVTLKHQQILLRVYEKIPEQAKKGVENALEKSLRGYESSVQVISKEKKEELESKAQEIKKKIKEKIEVNKVSIVDILDNPDQYLNKKVLLEEKYCGWGQTTGAVDPFFTRSGVVICENPREPYKGLSLTIKAGQAGVQGIFPKVHQDEGEILYIIGVVKKTPNNTPYLEVLEIDLKARKEKKDNL